MKINKRIANTNSSKKVPPAGNGNMLDNIITKNKEDRSKVITGKKK